MILSKKKIFIKDIPSLFITSKKVSPQKVVVNL